LWHFPVFAFFVYYNIYKATSLQTVMLLCITFVLSVASWQLIERPFHARRCLPNNKAFLGAMATVSVLLMTAGLVFWRLGGIPQRFAPELRRLLESTGNQLAEDTHCMAIPLASIRAGDLCSTPSAGPSARRIVLWGDSHAHVLRPALSLLSEGRGIQTFYAARPSCLPLINVDDSRNDPHRNSRCAEFNHAMVDAVRTLKPDLVILTGYWLLGAKTLVGHLPVDGPRGESALAFGLTSLLELIPAESPVCVVEDVPTLHYSSAYSLDLAYINGIGEAQLRLTTREALSQQAPVEEDLRSLALRGAIRLADLKDALCTNELCRVVSEGRSLYKDNNHLSPSGAVFVVNALRSCVTGIRS
jgi:hypothetical protein